MNAFHCGRRFSSRLAAAGLFLVVAAVGPARLAFGQAPPGTPLAGPAFNMSFDEKGIGFINGVPDPGIPVGGGGIDYFLPVPVIPGDVLVMSPGDVNATPSDVSDLLSFSNTGPNGNGVLLYRSLIDDSDLVRDPADVPNFPINAAFIAQEIGPEGNNGFLWAPPPGPGTTYQGISDTPEPSTLILSALGVIPLLVFRRRRRFAA
jgi:hypothetical protein